jgi:hypothetical protein
MAVSVDKLGTSRRRFLMTAPAAAVAVGKAILPADVTLKALYARWQRVSDRLEGTRGLTDEEVSQFVRELTVIEREMYACPIESLDGLAIMARVTRQYADPDEDDLDGLAFRALFNGIAYLAEGRA